jgi:hypothetical protein
MNSFCTFSASGIVHSITARVTPNGRGVADVFLRWEVSDENGVYNRYTPITLWSDQAHMIRPGDIISMVGMLQNRKHKRRDGSEYYMLEATSEGYQAVTTQGMQYSNKDVGFSEPNF